MDYYDVILKMKDGKEIKVEGDRDHKFESDVKIQIGWFLYDIGEPLK